MASAKTHTHIYTHRPNVVLSVNLVVWGQRYSGTVAWRLSGELVRARSPFPVPDQLGESMWGN